MASPCLLSRYGVSKAQVRPSSQGSTSRPTRSCGALVRPASQGAVRPASTGMLSFESNSRPTAASSSRRPCSAPEKGKKKEVGPAHSWSFAPPVAAEAPSKGGWLSVNQLHELTQRREAAGEEEPSRADPPLESRAASPPRFEGRQQRRERRRAPGQARRNAAARCRGPRLDAAPSERADDSDSESSSGSDGDSIDSPDKSFHKHHHHTHSHMGAAALLGDRSAASTAAGQQAERDRKRAQNPFVEYEDREQRLQNERRWLQEDTLYLAERREELRFNKVQRGLDVQHFSGDHLFQNAVIYNEYSHYIRTVSSLKEEVRRYKTEEGPLKELALPRIQRLKAARALQRQAEAGKAAPKQGEPPPRQGGKATWTPAMRSVKTMQHRLQKSHDDIERASGNGKSSKKKFNSNLGMDPNELLAKAKAKAKPQAAI